MQLALGGALDALLLAKVHTGGSSTPGHGAATAHLDEDHGLAVPHDQVDLAHLVTDVGRDKAQPGLLQVLAGLLLGLKADPLARGQARCVIRTVPVSPKMVIEPSRFFG